MDAETFEATLCRDGFSEIFRREIAPGNALPEHQHAWDARGLVLRGRFRVEEPGGVVQDCGPGEFFELPIDA